MLRPGAGLLFLAAAACGAPSTPSQSATAPLSFAADARMIAIPAGKYIAGSTPEERAAAYEDHARTSGGDAAREKQWFEREEDRHLTKLPAFRIDFMPVTQAQYAEFVATGAAQPPAIDEAAWRAQGFAHDYATQVARFVWRDRRAPLGREEHPVVLVTWSDANRYCAWRGRQIGQARRLPSSAEFEKAARGEAGFSYPWGHTFEPAHLNSAVSGPGDTSPAGEFSSGASPYGVLDMSGNVSQWTATRAPGRSDEQMIVKGSAWDDHAGVGRGASLHGRPAAVRHVIVGFRCAADAAPE